MRSPRARELGGLRAPPAEGDDVPDWQSTVSTCSSTVATTASLASRIASLAIDLEEEPGKAREFEELGTFREEEEEEEVVVEVTEEQLIQALDNQEDPFQVGGRREWRERAGRRSVGLRDCELNAGLSQVASSAWVERFPRKCLHPR
ncbi:unnamed protein product [Ostreobium quekettii]|uniref:Uncharacterized protein n=1 Tax=Ostreobium quekettii TaxID=121088 RepID=A0A8S1J0I4_9CHLO|nr:unnamed protein product [Ostreobium quekettii]